uniref:LAGLIDADG homing endonuclease n=1 Tax=Romanomermis culicivorax TaxID=13658 RepID=A0A915JE22_ROMCU
MISTQEFQVTVNAKSIKFGLCGKDKQGILMQQSALKKLYPFKTYESAPVAFFWLTLYIHILDLHDYFLLYKKFE